MNSTFFAARGVFGGFQTSLHLRRKTILRLRLRQTLARKFFVQRNFRVGQIGERQTPTGAPLFWFAADARSADPNVELRPQPEEVAAVEWRTLPSLLADADFLANNREIVRKIVDGEIALSED
jgi:hypothetical protein